MQIFELDQRTCQLRRDGQVVHLERIPLELLLLLTERRGQLVRREEIVERIWEGVFSGMRRQHQRCGKENSPGARAMFPEIYNWFTEGLDTADLKHAKALLDELES